MNYSKERRVPGFKFLSLNGEDKVRLISYSLAVLWPVLFLAFQPRSYNVISDVIIHIWMVISALGGIGAILGVLTGIDLKVELPSLYVVLMGPLLYFVAQIGFILSGDVDNRIALAAFALWHIALMLPRIVGLESFRQKERARKRKML